jgi:hypothetical protein
MKTSNPRLYLSDQLLQSSPIKLPKISIYKRVLQLVIPVFAGSNEPQLWTTKDRDGNISWHAYDPVSGHSISQNSEDEMRIWLEQRYYN